MLHGVALIDTDVSLQDSTNQKASVGLQDAVIQAHLMNSGEREVLFFLDEEVKTVSHGQASSASHLFTWVLWMFLEGPGDSGLEGLGDALQESAAAFHSIQLPLCHTVLMVVCRGQQSKRQEAETQSGLSGTGWKNEKGQEKAGKKKQDRGRQ